MPPSNDFTTRLTTKGVVALNSIMDSNDVTLGFFRRVFILPFNQQYVAPVPKELEQPDVLYMDLDLERCIW